MYMVYELGNRKNWVNNFILVLSEMNFLVYVRTN